MRAIKALTMLAVLAALAWGGYWFVGARALDRAVAEGLAAAPALTVEGQSVQGFPNRFDVTLTRPRLSLPGGEWTTPFVQVFALSYRLNHVVAVFAPDQRLRLRDDEAVLHAEDLRASVVVQPGLDLGLERVALAGEGLTLMTGPARHGIDRLRLASRRSDETAHDLVAVAEGVFPDLTGAGLMGAELPGRFDLLRLEAELRLDRPLDRHAATGPAPRVTGLALTGARAAWDGVDITLAGRLDLGPDGTFSGEVTAAVTGWRQVLALMARAGMLDPEQEARLEATLAPMAPADRLDVPLAVTGGQVWLGPLALFSLPPL